MTGGKQTRPPHFFWESESDMSKAREMNIKEAGRKCVHYARQNREQCGAGISLSQFGAIPHRPCFVDSAAPERCPKRLMPTREECERMVDEIDRELASLAEALSKVVEHARGRRGIRDKVFCPNCDGWLHYSISANGHVMANCTTKDCTSFIQ